MKKMTCLWLALAILALCAPALADEGVWTYDTTNQYLELDGELSGDVVIPSEVDGQPVRALRYTLFSGQHGIAALAMPDTVEALGEGAVGNMDGLTSVALSPNLTVIESGNFSNCPLLTSVTVPASVNYVADSFYWCDNLREIRFEGVCPVFYNTGWCFDNLPEDCLIYVPDDQLDAYKAAVGNEDGAADKMRPSGQNAVAQERATPESDFAFDAATGTITGYAGASARVDIPASIGGVPVKTIGASAFETYSLYYVTIPEGVEAIAEGAFAHASNLCVAEFPSTLKTIGAEAFMNAQTKVIKWSEGLVEIGARAFMYDDEPTLALPSTVKIVGESAFEGARLKELYLSGEMETIGARAFAKTPITYMAFDFQTPIGIAGDAFAETNVADLDLPWDSSFENRDAYAAMLSEQCPECTVWINNPISGGVAENPENTLEITKIENGVWTMYNGDAADLTVWATYDKINVTALGDALFKGNQSLRSFYPHHCGWFTTIGAEAFADSSVEYVELFGSITTIGDGAFRNCANLTELTIPASVTSVGEGILADCANLTKLTVLCDPAILPAGSLAGCAALTEVYAAENATDEQVRALSALADRPWNNPALRVGEQPITAQPMPYEPLPGEDFWYDETYARLDRYNGYEVNLVLPREIDGVELTMIGGNMLSRAAYGDDFEMELPVRSVVIPETYEELTYYGFANCETLETVVCYAPIENLPDGFFSGCINLRNVIFVNGVRNIGRDVFTGCQSLETLYLGEYVENVDEFAFRDEGRGDVFSLDRCIQSAEQMPDVDALLTAVAGEPIAAPESTPEPEPVEAAPIGAEGEAFFGTWYGVQMEMDGAVYNMADFGIDMRVTLNADGTAELFDGEETEAGAWTLADGVANVAGMALTLTENGELCMEEDGTKMIFSRNAASPATPTAAGEEGAAFIGTWYGVQMEMDGETYNMADFGIDMRVTLNVDGTAELFDGEETETGAWTLADGVANVAGMALTLTENGELCMEEDGTKMIFSRNAASPAAPTASPEEKEPQNTDIPETSDEPAAILNLSERLEKKYVMASADIQGMNMTAAMLGNYEYSLVFHADASVDFVMAGASVPGLTWTQGTVTTDAGEAEALIIDYYGTPLNAVMTEEGFDMNYFDSMLIHFVMEE